MTTALHDFAPEEIMAHQDGELPADQSQQISAHLETCAECRNVAESLHATSKSLANWNIETTPPLLQPQAINSLSQSVAVDSGTSLFSWQLLRNRRALLALGAVFSTVWFVFFEVSGNYRQTTKEALRGATRVDINNFNPPPRPARAGGGGGGDRKGVPGDYASVSRDSLSALPVIAEAPMIAHTAELQLVTSKFDAARTAVESILTRHHGYAASLNVGEAENAARTLNASLCIPSPELASALSKLKALGHLIHEFQGGEEVTAEHADLVARLKNSRETETRLQDILRNRTGKVADVLEVEQEIARVRGEIEQMESDLKTLNHRVDFATINLTITEEYKAKVSDSTPGVATRFHNAAVTGFKNVTDSAVGLTLWFAEYLPPMVFWLIILIAPIVIFWRFRRRAIAAVSASPAE